MASFCLCDYSKCEKSSCCKRYLIKETPNTVYMNFQNICYSKNNYRWWIEEESQALVKKEDVIT
jgi:hypothetical protein